MRPFECWIEMGNAAMRTPADVAESLRRIADRIETYGPTAVFGGPVMDANGNAVGHYEGAGCPEEES